MKKRKRKFIIGRNEVHIQRLEVMATSKAEALRLIDDEDESVHYSDFEFSHTLPHSTWIIEEPK